MIQLNEDTKLTDFRIRFSDVEWAQNLKEDIMVGGAGGIGSWLTLFLSRIGHTIYVFDFDTVDKQNIGGQLYGEEQISLSKVDALTNICKYLTGDTNVKPMNERVTSDTPISNIVFSCFDNMQARKTLFESWKANPDRELFIDGRMLAELGMCFFVKKGDEAKYEATLFEDGEVQEAPCSYKATSHCGAMLASMMVSGFNNYMYNNAVKADIREIPFKSEFLLPLMIFKTE